jgi:hypothetical protein
MEQPKLRVDQIKVGERHRKDMGDIAGLAASIGDVGLLQPLVVRPDYTLVCGARRLEAVKSLGWTEVPARVADNLADVLQALRAERDENTCRKGLSPSEMVALGRSLEEQERREAKARQQEGGRAGARTTHEKLGRSAGSTPTTPKMGSGTVPEPIKGDTRDKVGAVLGVGGSTYERAKAVVEAAEADPEKFGPIAQRMDDDDEVAPAYREMRRIQAQGSAPPELLRVERTAADDLTDLARTVRERLLGTHNQYGNPHVYVPAMPPGIRSTVRADLSRVIQALSAVVEEIDRCQSPKSPSGESTPTS